MEKMICPFCEMGIEMKQGYLQSTKRIIWSQKRKKHYILVNENDGDFQVSNGFWNGCYVDAWVCPRCKRIIVDPRREI